MIIKITLGFEPKGKSLAKTDKLMKKVRRERVRLIGISLVEDLLYEVISALKPTSTSQKKGFRTFD